MLVRPSAQLQLNGYPFLLSCQEQMDKRNLQNCYRLPHSRSLCQDILQFLQTAF